MTVSNKYPIINGHEIKPGANLIRADLIRADLSGADLIRADLSGANLHGANLIGANLSRADLSGTNLIRANLIGANLSEANLMWANLSEADLIGANLGGANLRRVCLPSPTMVLMAYWGRVSDDMTVELMRYDASCHPDPAAFDRWATSDDGPCPYDGVKVQRACYFKEQRDLWSPGPSKRPIDLMIALIKECCKDSDYHDRQKVDDDETH